MQDRQFLVESEKQRTFLSTFVARQPLPFQAQLGPIRKLRSLNQNARYWKIVSMAAWHTGYSAEEMHEEFLCQHFGYSEVERKNPWTGEIEMKRVPLKRSHCRDTKEFAAYSEYVENFVGENLGIWLPTP